jgi:hypothetical protein
LSRKRKTGNPVRRRMSIMRMEELQRIHADIVRLREDMDRRLTAIENQLNWYAKEYE